MIFRVVAALVAALSPRGRRVVAALLAFVVGRVLRVRRRHVGEAMGRAGVAADAIDAFYGALAEHAVDLLAVAGGRSIGLRAPRLTADARRALDAARREGPVVIAASHTGNWELAAFALAEVAPVAVVAKRQGSGAADRFVRTLRGSHGVVQLAPEGALAAVAGALEEGRVVVMPIDQAPARTSHASRGMFLGAPAWLDRAPFVLAKRARAQVLVAAVEGPRIHVLATLGRAALATTESATREAARLLEGHVRAFPASWLWLHRRWKEVPGAARKVAPVNVKKCSESRQVA